MHLLALRAERQLALARSDAIQQALCYTARRQSLPVGQFMKYSTVFLRDMIAALDKADQHMLCRAKLIKEHCEENGVSEVLLKEDHNKPWDSRIEIWVPTTVTGLRMLRYRSGLLGSRFIKFCEDSGCFPEVICPLIRLLRPGERVNPVIKFPSTPDYMDSWYKFLAIAN